MSWNPSWANAIASIESQGSGGYSAVGPTTQKGNRAYGKYQVMDFNIPTWTEKHLGQRLTPNQFLQSPEAQEAVFKGEFGSYVSKYGNPQDAASAWFTGRPQSAGANRSDVLGTTGSGYVNKFNNALGIGATSTGGQPMMQPEQKPKGLLGGLFSDPDKRARLAMALEGMTLNPNQGMMASLQGGIDQRGEDRKEAAAEAKKLAKTNKSLELLAGLPGGEEYVRIAEVAGVPTAMKAYLESKKAPKDTSTSAMRNYDEYQRILAEKGPEAAEQFLSTIKSGTTIKMPSQMGSVPQGYRVNYDDKGNPVSMSPIPGGPADISGSSEAQATAKAQSGSTVLGDITEMQRLINENPNLTTGLGAQIFRNIGGTKATDLNQLSETVRANIGFDRLQRMREESPTGGALGQVAVQELNALQASLGSLETTHQVQTSF